ncbi:MAG TPA: hypothetical protein PK208_15180 [Fibrobacteria bacterium]|nr:hypothetical protein [Fibrobacteria bacterium]
MSFSVHLLSVAMSLCGAEKMVDEVLLLRRNAEELLRQGQPAKALVLLQKAREADSLQADIDHMMNVCRAKLGGWVVPGAGADWNEAEESYLASVKRNPDSMYLVARKLAETENIPGALKVLRALTNGRSPKSEHLKAYADVKARQDALVSFHRQLAEGAVARGALSEALEERRVAFALKPDDPVLRTEIGYAEQAMAISLAAFAAGIRQVLARNDAGGAIALVAKARVAHPDDPGFRKTEDSLLAARRSFVAERLSAIDGLFGAGRFQEAAEAMESVGAAFPEDPGIAQAREALHDRILRRRKKDALDSLSVAFDAALAQGDVQGAQSVVERMKAQGAIGEELARFGSKIDSVRARERRAALFADAFGAARKALARGDTAAARGWTVKALAIQPDNAVAKALSGTLAPSRRPPVAPAKPAAVPVSGRLSKEGVAKVNALVMAGISAYRGGDYPAAMAKWKDALALDPGCVQASRYLENVERKQARLR